MRITFITPGGAGGGPRVICQYATGLLERGHDVQILYHQPPKDLRGAVRSGYLRLRFGKRDGWLHTFPGTVKPYARLTPEIVGQNDAVIGVGVDCVLAMAELPDSCGLKINNSHGREPWIRERMLEAWALPMPRIVVSSHLIKEMRDQGCKDEIHVVRNGIDRTQYYPCLPEDCRDGVGTVYHGGSVKDPELIIAVLRRLHDCRPATPIYVFGSYPRPRDLPASARYVRLPSLSVARELYSRSKVWFCASRSEGFPGPPLEAMACGCAVVSTDCGGPSDQIEDGVNGFLVPVGDCEQMVAKILRLLDDATMRCRLVAASESVLERLTWPRAIEAFEAAVRSIIEAKRGAE